MLETTPRACLCRVERVWVHLGNANPNIIHGPRASPWPPLPNRLPHDYAAQWRASKPIFHSTRFVLKPFSLLFMQ